MSVYTIPASSSPWQENIGNNTGRVHYADDTTNGAHYTWCAATAMEGRYCDGATTTNNESGYSICPRGWKLPKYSEYGNFLSRAGIGNDSTGSAKMRGAPYNFSYAGYIYSGSLSFVGSQGYYWSSTTSDSIYAFNMSFSSNGVNNLFAGRSYGMSIRCIAP